MNGGYLVFHMISHILYKMFAGNHIQIDVKHAAGNGRPHVLHPCSLFNKEYSCCQIEVISLVTDLERNALSRILGMGLAVWDWGYLGYRFWDLGYLRYRFWDWGYLGYRFWDLGYFGNRFWDWGYLGYRFADLGYLGDKFVIWEIIYRT